MVSPLQYNLSKALCRFSIIIQVCVGVIFIHLAWNNFLKYGDNKGVSLLQFLGKEYADRSRMRKLPVIYSYYRSVDFEQALIQNPNLLVWAEMWASTGWNPVLLTIDDARQHTDFSKHVADGMGISHDVRYTRYLAMSTITGGGWFSEYHLFPLYPNLNETNVHSLPNRGKFTSFDRHVPTFMSGNQWEWTRMAHALINHPAQSDMHALIDMHQQNPKSYFYENSVVLFRDVYNIPGNICEITKDKRAVRISPEDFMQISQNNKPFVDVVRSFMSKWRSTCLSSTNPIM